MKEFRHTPGPWRYMADSDIISTFSNKKIAKLYDIDSTRIIVFAPKMLEALIEINKYSNIPDSIYLASKVVIENATGMTLEEALLVYADIHKNEK